MNILQIKTEKFYYEHILDSKENKELIKDFKVIYNNAKGLELFLKEAALEDEENNSNRTYLVKDNETKEVVAYFSLRTGLVTMGGEKDFITIPSIELANFAVNSCYRENHSESKYLGAVVLSEFIHPIVRYISDFIAVKILYIYALPEEDLIKYYERLGFNRLDKEQERFVHSHIKPDYDTGCIFMYQLL